MTQVIAYPGDRPPILTSEPCDYRGSLWRYAPATPENARQALDAHRREWSDWGVDDALEALAAVTTGVAAT